MLKDMALKFSCAYKQCKPCTGSSSTYNKGQRPYIGGASSSATPAWDFTLGEDLVGIRPLEHVTKNPSLSDNDVIFTIHCLIDYPSKPSDQCRGNHFIPGSSTEASRTTTSSRDKPSISNANEMDRGRIGWSRWTWCVHYNQEIRWCDEGASPCQVQSRKIWRGTCQILVARKQRENTRSIPLKYVFGTTSI